MNPEDTHEEITSDDVTPHAEREDENPEELAGDFIEVDDAVQATEDTPEE